MLEKLVDFFTDYSYHAVFTSLLISGLGVPIPEDITLVAAGVVAGLEIADVRLMLVVTFVGVMAGDSIMFSLGHRFGNKVFEIAFFRRIVTPSRYEEAQRKFDKYGNWILFIARFLPGLRAVIYLISGTMPGIKYWRFFIMDSSAAILSVPIWVFMGYFGASNHELLVKWIHRSQNILLAILGTIAIVLVAVYFYRRRSSNPRNGDH